MRSSLLDAPSYATIAIAPVLVIGVLVCASVRVAAQPVDADRPGIATSASVVERGTAQIELGANFGREQGENVDTWVVPEPLLRVGVLERAELRLSADGFVSVHASREPDESTGSDLTLSAKVRLLDQARRVPATSIVAGLGFPTGGGAVTSDGYDPSPTQIASWQIDERFRVDANLGIATPTQGPDDSDRIVESFVAASWDVSVSDRIGAGPASPGGSGNPDSGAAGEAGSCDRVLGRV